MGEFDACVEQALSEMKWLGPEYDHLHFMDFCNEGDETWLDIWLTRMDGGALKR
jgi:hypothetical protein